MKYRKLLLIGLILIGLFGLVGLGAWYGWRRHTTPELPNIPLDGVSKEKAEKIEHARQAVQREPRSGKAWGDLGLTLLANGFTEQSISCFAHAQKFDPTEARWPYFRGGLMLVFGQRDGFTHVRQALAVAQAPRDRKAILFQLSLALVEDGQLDEAEQHTGELRALEGDSPRVDYLLGILAIGRDNRAAARAHLSKLTEHPSARKRTCALLASLVEGDAQLAEDYRRRAGELPADEPWIDSFESELVRYRAAPVSSLTRYLDLEAQGRHEEAQSALREIVKQSPDGASCYILAYSLFKSNQFEEAEQLFRQAIGFHSRNTKSHLFHGICLLQMGEQRLREADGKEKAMDLFRQAVAAEDKALALQTDIADAHLTRARALKHLGRTPEAIEAFRQAVRVGTEFAEMHQALGEALAEAGQLREGLEHLEDAVRLAKPDDPRPRQALEKWKGKAKP